jgi:hypothetical protein
MAPPPRLLQERIQERQTEGDRCPVCFRPVDRVSTYCRRHSVTKRDTGSPQGGKLLVADLAPYLAAVVPWLTLNAKHPDIIAAAEAIARRLEAATRDVELRPRAGRQPIPKLYSREQTKAVAARLNVYLKDLAEHGMAAKVDAARYRSPDKPRCEGRVRVNLRKLTTAELVLAYVAAAYLHRHAHEEAEIAFWDTNSADHFPQQIGSLILRRAREHSLRKPWDTRLPEPPGATVARAFGRLLLVPRGVIEKAAIRLSILARRGDLASQCEPPYQVPPPPQRSADFCPKRPRKAPSAAPLELPPDEPSPQLPDQPELPDLLPEPPSAAPLELPRYEPDIFDPEPDIFLPASADPHQQPHDGA